MDKTLPFNRFSATPVLIIANVDNFGFTANVENLSDLLNDDFGFVGNWNLYVEWTSISAGESFRPGIPNVSPSGTFFGWDLAFVYSKPDEIDLNCISFTPLVYGATAPSFITKYETNWLTYWKDRQKTFEYYSNAPSDESTKVEISTNFCKYGSSSTKDILSITNSLTAISRLAPSLLDSTQDRFNGRSPLTPISAPNNLYDIYFYNYLMIVRVDNDFPVQVGDVINLASSVVDAQFVVNKIKNISNWNHLNSIELRPSNSVSRYLYMYMDFNDNIITELIKSQNAITITNLNKFQDLDQLNERFNIHPISHGYKLTYNGANIKIDSKFNNITSYYNLATKVIFDGLDVDGLDVSIEKKMVYTDGFLKFGYTPTYNLLDYLEGLNDTTNLTTAKFTADKEYYAMPHYKGLPSEGSGNATSTNVYFDYNGISYGPTYSLNNI
jgi:hypothetical protein